jgi:hypothetical protein
MAPPCAICQWGFDDEANHLLLQNELQGAVSEGLRLRYTCFTGLTPSTCIVPQS